MAIGNLGVPNPNAPGAGGTADVEVVAALPAGDNNIGNVDVVSLPAIPAGTNNIGDVDIASIAAGDNNIGNVDVVTLPSIPAGTNNIGDVDVLTLPSLPAGSNSIGTLGANSGVDIGDVTINNASGASAVNIQDGGNTITVDGSGTAGTAASGVVTVQGIASMTPVQVSQATASNLNATVVQGTATNLKAQAECYQGGSAVASGNPLQVTLANTGANATAVKTNVASGGIASGAIASGAIASGAIASGALASGSVASGALVDITNLSTPITPATATATKAINLGAEYRSTLPTWTNTQQGALQVGTRGSLHVELFNTDSATAVPSGSGTATGALRVEIANNGTGLVTTNPATAANWAIYVEDNGETAGGNLMMAGSVRRDTAASSSGTTGDNSTINTAAEGQLWATLAPTTTSGLSVANFNTGDTYTALTNSAQVIKASAGNLYGYYIYNPNSSATYVMIYNIAAASVTVGTSTAQMVFCIPATSGANLMFPYPISFSNAGWSIAAATTGGGNTAPATALEAMIWYK